MRSYVNSVILANLVSMLRADVDGAIWLIDDDSEGRFYEKCAHPSSRVVSSQGVALDLLNTVQQRGTAGVVVAMRRSRQGSLEKDNIFIPDLGDVASLLLLSEGWERVLEEVTGGAWRKACEKEIGPLLDRVVKIAWLVQNLGISPLAAENLESLIDWRTLDLAEKSIDHILGVPFADRLYSLQMQAEAKTTRGLLVECDGMNAIRVAALATKLYQPRGLRAEKAVDAESLLAMLRVAFNLGELERDSVFWRMRKWERLNSRYPLLRKWRMLDPLQSVWDQRYWEGDLERFVEYNVDGETLTAFKMDLDNFKQVNDTLGHDEGDSAIRRFCAVVLDVLRDSAEIYRRGGDEVVAFAPGLNGHEGVKLAERLRRRVEDEFRNWGKEKGIDTFPTASIGVVEAPSGTLSEDLIDSMDRAQKRAKSDGKNRVVFLRVGDRESL